jgi:hypothetical protein
LYFVKDKEYWLRAIHDMERFEQAGGQKVAARVTRPSETGKRAVAAITALARANLRRVRPEDLGGHQMTRLTRRSFAAGTGALAVTGFSIGRARAAEFTYKFANNLALTHPLNKRAQEAAGKIKEETGGRFELQIFPSSQLGSDTDTLGQIRSGAVDFFTRSGLIL